MGALHEGHLSLVRHGLIEATRLYATVFVNPTQFAPGEDFAVYPRDEGGDIESLERAGAHLLFAPGVEEMYPTDHAVKVSVPGLGDILEGEFRPGFFDGVATVVTKLLLQGLPDLAVFGEKDYQQLQVIKRLAIDLNIPVRVVGAPTVREADGLAMSSRNAYLDAGERAVAPELHRAIASVAAAVRKGADPAAEAARAEQEVLAAGFEKVDYLTVRDADRLQPVTQLKRPARVLAAAHLGTTRLIDNVAV